MDLETELELAVMDALAGRPATPGTLKTVRRVVEARLRPRFGRDLRSIGVRSDGETVFVELEIARGPRVRAVRVSVG